MKLEPGTDILKLESTGREVWANNSILGMTAEGEVRISEGYDGGIREEFTASERREIAEHMIARWREWGGSA